MARYTASPLGLIPESSSDIKNFRYKTLAQASGDKQPTKQSSIFSSSHTMERADNDSNANTPRNYSTLHTEDRYDLSTTNIIKQLADIPSMSLKYSDFAYCRDFGVYPNNRLIVCRKFGGPVGDDLNIQKESRPLATVISWFDDTSLPVSINFGEEWVDAETSFKTVLNNFGKDLGLEKININLGDVASQGGNLLPLPGVFEPFTRQILQNVRIGGEPIIAPGDPSLIPAGQPNLIKEAKQRKLISDDLSGSGLNGKISVAVKCSWEQKFIAGQDPTNIYYDLLRTILHFGGQDGTFYMGGGAGLNKIMEKFLRALKNPGELIAGILEGIKTAISVVVEKVKKLVGKFFEDAQIKDNTAEDGPVPAKKDESPPKSTLSAEDVANNNKLKEESASFLSKITELLTDMTKGLANKYKHVLMGIVSSLTGAPSTPWHVTIGNPLRPIFCSGDMWTSDVKLTLGPTLAFNDLPSSVDIEFTLSSARTSGIDEIFRKLSTGEIRFSSSSAPSFYNTNQGEEEQKKPENSPTITDNKNEELADGTQPYDISAKTKVGSTNAVGLTSSNGTQVNPDPNSSPIQKPLQNSDPNGGFTDEELAEMAKEDSANTSSTFEERKAASEAKGSADDKLSGETKPVEEPPEPWVPGKRQNSGARSQQSVFLKWQVVNGNSPGSFIARWDLADTVYGGTALTKKESGGQGEATYNTLSEAISNAQSNNESEFDKALAIKGLTKIQ